MRAKDGMTRQALPRFAKKDIRDFAGWLIDHGWVYTGDDSKGHAQFTYPPNSATTSLPETPGYFPVKARRTECLRAMGVDTPGRRAKPYVPARKATSRQALTDEQLERTCEVVTGKFGEFIRATYREGKPTATSHVLDRMRRDLLDAIREHA